MLTPDMKRIVEEQLLGFVATTASDGTPNLSPKGAFFVVDDNTIAFGEVRSPGTIRNLRANPRIEINFVDPFVRKGYRFAGTAVVVERGTDAFETLLGHYHGALRPRLRAIVAITVTGRFPSSPFAGGRRRRMSGGWTTVPQASAEPAICGMTICEVAPLGRRFGIGRCGLRDQTFFAAIRSAPNRIVHCATDSNKPSNIT